MFFGKRQSQDRIQRAEMLKLIGNKSPWIIKAVFYMDIGKRIKQRRKELRMSADELGAKLGKDRSTIYRYENGDIEKLPLDILEPIAEALHTTPACLLGWENQNISDVIIRMGADEDFLFVVETILRLDSDKLNGVKQLLSAFLK